MSEVHRPIDLVAQLRAAYQLDASPLFEIAAEEIEQLRGEKANLLSLCEFRGQEIDRLRAALERRVYPFSALASWWSTKLWYARRLGFIKERSK